MPIVDSKYTVVNVYPRDKNFITVILEHDENGDRFAIHMPTAQYENMNEQAFQIASAHWVENRIGRLAEIAEEEQELLTLDSSLDKSWIGRKAKVSDE